MKSQRKLVSPWEYTYDEFTHDMLFHPVGEPWQPNHTNPLNRPLLTVGSVPRALNYLDNKAGHLLLIDPPYDFLERKGIYDTHPKHGHDVIGLSREPLSKLRDRVAAIAIAKDEDQDIKALFGENGPLQKWHFTQVVKAFMSRRYVPLRVMMNYEVPLARWAHKQKARSGDGFLRLPHSIAKRQHGRDSKRERLEYRLESALDDSYFMGDFDKKQQAYVFTETAQIQRELDIMTSEANRVQALNATMTDGDLPIDAHSIVNEFSRAIKLEQHLIARTRPITPNMR